MTRKIFGGFWCRDCGGRVFQDQPYKDGNGQWMAVLVCLLCAKNHQCTMKEYKHLLRNIEEIVYGKKSQGTQKSVLSDARKAS